MKSSNRVVRYHRWLRDIALPEESASTNAFSTATQPGRTTAERAGSCGLAAAHLRSAQGDVRDQDERHQSEPGGKYLPGRAFPLEIQPGALSPPGQRVRS